MEEIERAKILVRVLDQGILKDDVIGAYEFDVGYIYFMKGHALLHKWVALLNPDIDQVNEAAGYLKLSIAIATTGDEQI